MLQPIRSDELSRRAILLWISFAAVLLLVVAGLFAVVHYNRFVPGDVYGMDMLYAARTDTATAVMHIVSDMGSPMIVLVIATLAACALWYRCYSAKAVFVLVSVVGAIAIGALLKMLIARQRPEMWEMLSEVSSMSFPSGHATASSVLGLVVLVVLWANRYRWYVGVGVFAYIVAVGVSRVYLGVHYPSDVLAAWCMCGAWVIIVKLAVDVIAARWRART